VRLGGLVQKEEERRRVIIIIRDDDDIGKTCRTTACYGPFEIKNMYIVRCSMFQGFS
jgi:hypothetical protein